MGNAKSGSKDTVSPATEGVIDSSSEETVRVSLVTAKEDPPMTPIVESVEEELVINPEDCEVIETNIADNSACKHVKYKLGNPRETGDMVKTPVSEQGFASDFEVEKAKIIPSAHDNQCCEPIKRVEGAKNVCENTNNIQGATSKEVLTGLNGSEKEITARRDEFKFGKNVTEKISNREETMKAETLGGSSKLTLSDKEFEADLEDDKDMDKGHVCENLRVPVTGLNEEAVTGLNEIETEIKGRRDECTAKENKIGKNTTNEKEAVKPDSSGDISKITLSGQEFETDLEDEKAAIMPLPHGKGMDRGNSCENKNNMQGLKGTDQSSFVKEVIAGRNPAEEDIAIKRDECIPPEIETSTSVRDTVHLRLKRFQEIENSAREALNRIRARTKVPVASKRGFSRRHRPRSE